MYKNNQIFTKICNLIKKKFAELLKFQLEIVL